MQEMRADGLGMLACEAEEIQRASEDAGSRQIGAERSGKELAAERGELRSSIKQRKAAWLEMLMTCAGWKRSKCTGNVISWNLGPCGLEQAKQEIRKTLQIQKLTLDCLEQAIKAREHEYGILGGDLNAGMARAQHVLRPRPLLEHRHSPLQASSKAPPSLHNAWRVNDCREGSRSANGRA